MALLCLFCSMGMKALGGTYYVASNGSDTNPGTKASPWRTIQKSANTLAAGDIVLVQPGIYVERVHPNASGASDLSTYTNWITYKADGPQWSVTNAGGFYINQDWIRVDGFNIPGAAYGTNIGLYNKFEGAIEVYKQHTGQELINNYIHDFDPTNTQVEGIQYTFANGIAQNCQYALIGTNLFDHCSDFAVSITASNGLVVGNTIKFNNTHDAFHFWGSRLRICYNYITNLADQIGVPDHTDIFQTYGDGSGVVVCTNVLIDHNFAINCNSSCFMMQPATGGPWCNIQDFTIADNVFINVALGSGMDVPNTKIYNNLWVNCVSNTGAVLLFGTTGNFQGCATNCSVFNNAFVGNCARYSGNQSRMGWYDTNDSQNVYIVPGFRADYNFVCNSDFTAKAVTGDYANPYFQELHGINGGDPKLNPLWQPMLGSPLIDAGTSIAAVTNDYAGNARPLGSAYDIGPFEFDPSLLLRFDPSAGFSTNFPDLSGNGRAGLRMNAPTWPSRSMVSGRAGARFSVVPGYFDGSVDVGLGGYVAITNLSGINVLTNGALSIWAWYYQTQSGGTNWDGQAQVQRLFDGGYQGMPWSAGTFFLGRGFSPKTGDNYQTVVRSYTTNNAGNPTTLLTFPDLARTTGGDTTNWHHYVVTWSGTNGANNLLAYFDGQLCDSNAMGVPYFAITNDFNWASLGCWTHDGTPQWGDDPYPNNGWFNGLLGETRIYNRSLGPAEVRSLYLGSGGALSGPSSSSSTNPPAITAQPQSVVVALGQSASFSVSANGAAPLSYQWQFNGGNIAGATSSAYTIASVQATDAGSYSVIVANSAGSVTSTAATLAMTQAVGAINSVVIEPNGWVAQVVISGLNAGGSYSFGWSANNDPSTSSPKLAFSVVSPGFDDSGNPTSVTRIVYGTKQLRLPYPNAATMDEAVVANSIRLRVALSEFIYAGDLNILGTIGAGMYSASGNSNLGVVAFPVSNTSTQGYSKVIGNWSWPGYERATGSTVVVRCLAFNRFAQQGRPVRAVRFWVADAHGHTVNSTVTSPTVDAGMGDAVPIVEYIATLPTSVLNQADPLTCNFAAYPWIGDAASVLDTSDSLNVQPTPYYSSLSLLCDTQGNYGSSVAVVDPVAGNDQTGQATAAPLNTNSPPPAFSTIRGAATALASRNAAAYGRNDVGAGNIYLRAGTHLWTGGTGSYGGKPQTWLTITRYPSDARTSVIIGGQAGNSDISGRVKLQDVTIASGSSYTFSGVEALWFDSCIINSPSIDLVDNCTLWFATRCLIQQMSQGFIPFGVQTTAPVLIRGNQLIGFKGSILTYTAIGNSRTGNYYNGGNLFVSSVSSQGPPVVKNAICAFNRIYGFQCSDVNALSFFGGTQVLTSGAAIVQNLFENTTNGYAILAHCAADLSTGDPVKNVLVWHNTFVGQRWNGAYNDVGTNAYLRSGWSIKNNIFEQYNIKSDIFTGNNGPNGNRIGNWPVLYGVGAAGNLDAETQGIGAAGSFPPEFPGLRCFQPTSVSTNGLIGFVAARAFDGVNSGAGGGDYHLRASSPAAALSGDWLLPYDLDGSPRGAGDASGVYCRAQASNVPPTIVGQPQNVNTTVGGTATFSVVAAGTTPLSYQWLLNGANLAGATGGSYTLINAQTADAGNYSAVVANSAGSVTSSNALLTVATSGAPPSITAQPQNATVNAGASVTFSVSATGTAPLSYQWRLNGANLTGATSSTYVNSNVQPGDAGNYSVLVSNAAGSVTSSSAVLTVASTSPGAPSITAQPQSVTADIGTGVTFSVAATGTAPLSYQWSFNGANIAGATASAYTRTNVDSRVTGGYSVTVSNAAGTVTSSGAVLTVREPGLKLHFDFDEDFSSGRVMDVSGNANDGSQSDPANLIKTASGVFGGTAAQFSYVATMTNGSSQVFLLSQCMAVTNLTGFATLTNGTISLWARFDTNSDLGMNLLSAGYPQQYASDPSAASNSWSICRDSSSYLTFLTYPAGVYKRQVVSWPDDTVTPGGSAPVLATTSFHLYTVTVDCPNNWAVAFYDGLPYMTNAINLPWIKVYGSSSVRWLCLGASSGDNAPPSGGSSYPHSGYMAGKLDDLRIYNRALTAVEVQNLYFGRPTSRPGAPKDLRELTTP